MLQLITDGKVNPEEAVRAYHGVLRAKGIRPHRSLEDDLKLTDQSMSYGGVPDKRSTVTVHGNAIAPEKHGKARTEGNGSPAPAVAPSDETANWPQRPDGSPDFGRMNSAQRLAYDRRRLTRMFG